MKGYRKNLNERIQTSDLIETIADETGVDIEIVKDIIFTFIDVTKELLLDKHPIVLRGLMRMYPAVRRAGAPSEHATIKIMLATEFRKEVRNMKI